MPLLSHTQYVGWVFKKTQYIVKNSRHSEILML